VSHDQHFKNLILDYPREALAFFASEEAGALDATVQITPIRQEQLQERLGERFRELDVPLLVEWPDGRREALLFALEEETEGRRFSVHRLAHYCVDLAELLETSRVVPVVIFLRGGQYDRELQLGSERHIYLDFRYLVCNLPTRPSPAWFESDNLVARLNLPNMDPAGFERVEVYARAVRGFLELEPDPEKQLKYLDFVDIYTGLDENERETYRQRYPEEGQRMEGFAERFTRKGLEQGREQGMQQGMQQGEAAVLMRLLERRFGPEAAEAWRERVETADAETLLVWSDRILTASTPEELFR